MFFSRTHSLSPLSKVEQLFEPCCMHEKSLAPNMTLGHVGLQTCRRRAKSLTFCPGFALAEVLLTSSPPDTISELIVTRKRHTLRNVCAPFLPSPSGPPSRPMCSAQLTLGEIPSYSTLDVTDGTSDRRQAVPALRLLTKGGVLSDALLPLTHNGNFQG